MTRKEATAIADDLNTLGHKATYYANVVLYNWVIWKTDNDGYTTLNQVLGPAERKGSEYV